MNFPDNEISDIRYCLDDLRDGQSRIRGCLRLILEALDLLTAESAERARAKIELARQSPPAT